MKKTALYLLVAFALVFSVSCKKKNIIIDKEKTASRIVSLSPAATEILFAIGAGNQVVAVSDYSDFPPEAASLPKAGGFDGNTISIESILSFNPDFVYLTSGMHDFLKEPLDEFHINYYFSEAASIKDVEDEILFIGTITGHRNEAENVVQEMQSKLDFSTAAVIIPAYYEVWNSPYMSCGKSSFINEILSKAGFHNIFMDVEQDYPIVSEETIISRQPWYIFIPASSGVTVEAVKNRNGWNEIPAIKNNNIYIIDDNLITRPGPRIPDAVLLLNSFIH